MGNADFGNNSDDQSQECETPAVSKASGQLRSCKTFCFQSKVNPKRSRVQVQDFGDFSLTFENIDYIYDLLPEQALCQFFVKLTTAGAFVYRKAILKLHGLKLVDSLMCFL